VLLLLLLRCATEFTSRAQRRPAGRPSPRVGPCSWQCSGRTRRTIERVGVHMLTHGASQRAGNVGVCVCVPVSHFGGRPLRRGSPGAAPPKGRTKLWPRPQGVGWWWCPATAILSGNAARHRPQAPRGGQAATHHPWGWGLVAVVSVYTQSRTTRYGGAGLVASVANAQ
jgi:hypothetical protein